MRRFLSLEPTTVGELLGQSGWVLGPDGRTLQSVRDDEVAFYEQDDGRVLIEVPAGEDASDILERVPFEELDQ